MEKLPENTDARLLVGIHTHDDSGVFFLSNQKALIQTVDFFTPIVDDPYDYGQIAVANSLSDIYAMGATPLTALNIIGFPITSMDKNILIRILKGGWDKAHEAEVVIVGGHSVKDPEIKYGLAVTAIEDPKKIIRNDTAQIGDLLILTKPLGTGILTTALKNEKLPSDLLKLVTKQMKRLNKFASDAMKKYIAHACTDITGFGFLGHLSEMMRGSNKTAVIKTKQIPLLPEVLHFMEKRQIPGGLLENIKHFKPHIKIATYIDEPIIKVLSDPQTSGGLLISIPASQAQNCLDQLHLKGDRKASIVGEVVEDSGYSIEIL